MTTLNDITVRALKMHKADGIRHIAQALKDEQEKAHALYCKYYALYDLCQEITMFGYDKKAEERLIELVRKEALEDEGA
jgi:Fe-S-cluster formation regulator IscX/YfhJ